MTQQPSFGLFGMLERAGDTYDFEFVRELTQVELERLRYCGQLLNKFSAYSPFEMALAKYEEFLVAEKHALEHPVRPDVTKCVDLAFGALEFLLTLPGRLTSEHGEEQVISGELSSSLIALRGVTTPLVEALTDPENALLFSTGVMVLVGRAPVQLSEGISRCLAVAEGLVWQLAQDLSASLDSACTFVRHLAADVPIGRPIISPLPLLDGHPQEVEPLRIEDAFYVQQLVRSPPPSTFPSAYSPDQAATDSSRPRPVNLERRQEAPDQSTVQERGPLLSIRPDLARLVSSLSADSAQFLFSWSAAIDRQLLGEDLESMRAAVGAIVELIGTAVAESKLSGVQLPKYPPDAQTLCDLANNDQLRSTLEALGTVTAAQVLAEQAEKLPASRMLKASDCDEAVTILDPCVARDLLTLSGTLAHSIQSGVIPPESAKERSVECLSAGRMLSALVYALAACRSNGPAEGSLQEAATKVIADCVAGRVSEACCAPYVMLLLEPPGQRR